MQSLNGAFYVHCPDNLTCPQCLITQNTTAHRSRVVNSSLAYVGVSIINKGHEPPFKDISQSGGYYSNERENES